MTLDLKLTPHAEAWLNDEAQEKGLLPADVLQRIIEEHATKSPQPQHNLVNDRETDPTIALLQSWIDEDATDDPDEIRQAEEELVDFKRNMNATRKEAGERLLFPEVE